MFCPGRLGKGGRHALPGQASPTADMATTRLNPFHLMPSSMARLNEWQ